MKPKLSVVLIAYNHEPFIRKALDGILMQKVDFPYEIVVGEDCSTDHTRDILREYAEKFPGRFRLLFREKNLGRPTLNVYLTSMECQGKYIAYLEGDDYWTDENKLQKQVDFLDSHPDYMGTTHSFRLIGEHDEPVEDADKTRLYKWSGDYTFADWQKAGAWPGQTASNVCRNFYKNGKLDYSILYRAHDFVDDGVIFTFLLLQGKIYRFDDVMAAHRVIKKSGGGSWTSLKMKRNYLIEECELKLTMMQWVEENVGLTSDAFRRAKGEFKTAASCYIKHPSAKSWKLFKRAFGYYIMHLRLGKAKRR
ncbi:glycosyltransferase family 2 protein [Lachnospiraceae bacterium C1.1]|nr:glycosyltransferase [Lachnospiraceae bacterium C1.1]